MRRGAPSSCRYYLQAFFFDARCWTWRERGQDRIVWQHGVSASESCASTSQLQSESRQRFRAERARAGQIAQAGSIPHPASFSGLLRGSPHRSSRERRGGSLFTDSPLPGEGSDGLQLPAKIRSREMPPSLATGQPGLLSQLMAAAGPNAVQLGVKEEPSRPRPLSL